MCIISYCMCIRVDVCFCVRIMILYVCIVYVYVCVRVFCMRPYISARHRASEISFSHLVSFGIQNNFMYSLLIISVTLM